MSATATDMFCGAGGSSIGAEKAGVELRLGLNHWTQAIETHAANFQNADHDCTDVSACDPRRYPKTDILLASPECTNHSLAKGARRRKPTAASMFEDGPAGDDEQDRSRATMWDVIRFAEHHAYKAIVVENVVDAFKWGPDDNGALFDAWLNALTALGYKHEIVFLNSMFCPPTPQSRDRMYVVFWRKGIRKPNLAVHPPAWCPACETVVLGRQQWKRLDRRPWGRYGVQYLYGCPDCNGAVFPGAFPAASAIDWSLPAQRIGDRKRPLAVNTRNRIKRGLERLSTEPFAIRLTHGGGPRPLTLPLVTLTKRHDISMVLPPMGSVTPRDADTAPLPSQTTTTRAALVYSNRANNVPRPAEEQPSHPVLTGSTLGVVMRNNKGGAEMSTPAHEPIRTLTSRGHQSLVLPYNRTAQARFADSDVVPTLSTRDRLALVVPFTRNGRSRDAEIDVAPTMTAEGPPAVVFAEDDIDDCRFRMFDLHEIADAMVMRQHVDGTEYQVLGNKRERMAQYGNAVTPPAMELLVGRLLEVIG